MSKPLLPLLKCVQTLEKDLELKLVKLTSGADATSCLSDANCRVLAQLLGQRRFKPSKLEASFSNLSSRGLSSVACGIAESCSLEKVSFRNNRRAKKGLSSKSTATSILKCATLKDLDISENHLDFYAVNQFKTRKDLEVVDYGNFVFEEVLNSLTHLCGTVLAILGSVVLLYNSVAPDKDRFVFYSSLIYSLTLVFLFSASAIYHSSFSNKRLADVLIIVDHAAIYLLIAGTYTPFCLVSLQNHWSGAWIAVAEWTLAFCGIALTLVQRKVAIPFFSVIELALYLAMGHLLYIVWEDIETQQLLKKEAVELLVYGGYAYCAGIVFFLLDRLGVSPAGHVIWHLFVLVGSVFHYFAVLLYVVGLNDIQANKEGAVSIEELLALLNSAATMELPLGS